MVRFVFLSTFASLTPQLRKMLITQPSAEELLYRLLEHSDFTKLDLKNGYFQTSITRDDKEKPAFVVCDENYEFNVVPQGLMNAPASFQRVMNN